MAQENHPLPERGRSLIGERANFVADYLVIGSMVLWFALVTYPMLQLSSWEAYSELASDVLIKWQLAGLATGILGLSTANFIRGLQPIPPGEGVKAGIFFVMLMLLVAQTLVSLSPMRSFQYILLTSASFLLMPTVWRMPEEAVRRLVCVLCVMLSGFLLAAPALYGMPQNRWFGGIQPNQYGEPCLVIVSLFFLLRTPLRFIFLALAVTGIFVVNTRGGMVIGLLFALIWYGVEPKRLSIPMLAVVAACLTAVLMSVILALDIDPFGFVATEILRADDAGRSLTTFSGRMEKWAFGIDAFLENIFIGVGFRVSRSETFGMAHSGILQTLIDLGILGAFVILLLLAASVRLLLASRRMRPVSSFHADLMRWGGTLGIVYLMRATFEPTLLSFGNVMSLTFIAAISVPVFKPALEASIQTLEAQAPRWELPFSQRRTASVKGLSPQVPGVRAKRTPRKTSGGGS